MKHARHTCGIRVTHPATKTGLHPPKKKKRNHPPTLFVAPNVLCDAVVPAQAGGGRAIWQHCKGEELVAFGRRPLALQKLQRWGRWRGCQGVAECVERQNWQPHVLGVGLPTCTMATVAALPCALPCRVGERAALSSGQALGAAGRWRQEWEVSGGGGGSVCGGGRADQMSAAPVRAPDAPYTRIGHAGMPCRAHKRAGAPLGR